jgi:ribose transport system ATP-binding protein
MDPSRSALEMRHIRKTFPGVVALDDMHLDLREGEVHVLLGENGAGKSTLMKILSGAYRKDSGQIFLRGEEVEIQGPKHAQKLGIGIIYQELNLVPYLTAGENVFLGREPRRIPGVIDQKALFAAAQEILDRLGLSINARTLVSELGVAEQQMVEVAKALSLNARILIMDEPTSALTEQEITELFATIRRLKAKGVSIIYISHRMDELFAIGDRVTVFRDGLYIGTESIAAVDQRKLIRMMVGRSLEDQYPKRRAKVGEALLKVDGLTNNDLLQNISFSLHRGEVLGIAGLMGSGRTALARALFGVEKYLSGTISVHGKPEKFRTPRQAINRGLGYLTEDRKSQGLVLVLSVKDNICLPSVEQFSRFGIVDEQLEREAADKYVRELRIKTPTTHQPVVYLSGGNQQKVVLSKLLCTESDILIFDEPTRGIDVGSKVEIYELMNALTAQGVGIIMISSELPEILGMSDRILVMDQGKIAAEFSAEEATQEAILRCAIGGKK